MSVDARLIGLEPRGEGGDCRFVLVPHLCRPDGALFGGAALAASMAAIELASGRPALWATTQFVSPASTGDQIDCRVELLARGKYIDQLRLTASNEGRLVFTALGSTATRRDDGVSGYDLRMPDVAPPDESQPFGGSRSWSQNGETGHHRVSEFREAGTGDRPGHMLMWGRISGETATTAAKLGFLADMVPVAVCRAAGVAGAGTSLDNSLRVGQLVDTEWVLLEHEGEVADRGYGYGAVRIWSPDGVLMATGSQTAKLFSIDSFFGRAGE
jgi:acyl-CoA thioesterase II